MKRPEGFDRASGEIQSPAKSSQPTERGKRSEAPAEKTPAGGRRPTPPRAPTPEKPQRSPEKPQMSPEKPLRSPEKPSKSGKAARTTRQVDPDRPDTARARRDLRRAAAARRRYERGEVRRFTRRSRRRKVTTAVAVGCVLLLGGFVVAAVYSPLLSLRTISVVGTSRIDKSELLTAVDGQLGTPLALVDFSKIRSELSKFPLIRSYVTESVPPNTLVIRITERAPIAAIQTATGFSVVDPAGVVLQEATERPKGMPLVTSGAAITTSAAFTASVDVILALPATLATQVDSVTAATKDDVTLTLTGGQKVVWGSSDESELKARVLADLIKAQGGASVTYNVSAPTNPVIGPG